MTDTPKTFGSLFAGIGGFDLGLERCGLVCKWQVEIDPFCRQVLAKHWPSVPRHDDVTTFPPGDWTDEALAVDLICAGWPCQDISKAGKGAGLDGSQSRLFFDAVRIARQLKTRWVVLENVPTLFLRGFADVLRTLAEGGFNVRWEMLSAAAVGAPHLRRRLFLLCELADTARGRMERHGSAWQQVAQMAIVKELPRRQSARGGTSNWSTEPGVARMAARFSGGMDRHQWKNRVKSLGNSVVPQCVEELCQRWGWVTAARAAWILCEACGNFFCTHHDQHAHDCRCPSIETWAEHGLDPYTDAHPGGVTFGA